MKAKMRIFLALAVVFVFCLGMSASAGAETIKMSTTTSTLDSGLLDYLLPEFTKETGIEIQVMAKGTGAAIRDGQDGNVDVIFVHDPSREIAFVADGYGTKRYEVMHNDFVIVGPASDPAGIKNAADVYAALKAIANSGQSFISRGDDSGTHSKELGLWKATGLPMIASEKIEVPAGEWYLSIGQGMGKTLLMAEEKQAYALSDRGTFIQQKFGKSPAIELEILYEGDSGLFNPYGVIPVNPEKYPHTKIKAATTFAEWLVSSRGQSLIANYLLEGKPLFFPDAIPDAK